MQRSKTERPAASLFNASTEVRDRFWMKRYGTSPRVKRISGSKNFRSPPQKDFCNNICQEETLRGYPNSQIGGLIRLSCGGGWRSPLPSERPQFLAADREGQSATRLALNPDVAAYHLSRSSADGDANWAPWPKFGKIPGTVHSRPAATAQTAASNGLTYGRRHAGGSVN